MVYRGIRASARSSLMLYISVYLFTVSIGPYLAKFFIKIMVEPQLGRTKRMGCKTGIRGFPARGLALWGIIIMGSKNGDTDSLVIPL